MLRLQFLSECGVGRKAESQETEGRQAVQTSRPRSEECECWLREGPGSLGVLGEAVCPWGLEICFLKSTR